MDVGASAADHQDLGLPCSCCGGLAVSRGGIVELSSNPSSGCHAEALDGKRHCKSKTSCNTDNGTAQ